MVDGLYVYSRSDVVPDNLYCISLLEIDIVMSSSLFMLITYYSVVTDNNECD